LVLANHSPQTLQAGIVYTSVHLRGVLHKVANSGRTSEAQLFLRRKWCLKIHNAMVVEIQIYAVNLIVNLAPTHITEHFNHQLFPPSIFAPQLGQ
jgi:hypothetical protein